MTQLPTRRQALAQIGASAVGCVGLHRFAVARRVDALPGDLLALAQRVRAVPADDAFDFASRQIRAGTRWQSLLGAVFLAGAQGIRPRPHGILHSVMMVESTFQLAAAAGDPRQAWHAVLFNLNDFKVSQLRDIREWRGFGMQPLRVSPAKSAAVARREFFAAMEAFDAQRAESALVAWLPHVEMDEFFEQFRPLAARCSAFIGHKMIYATQVERVVRRIGWKFAEPALRSLTVSVLVGRDTELLALSQAAVAKWPQGQAKGEDDIAATERLYVELREASPAHAVDSVMAAVGSGLSIERVWDAIVLLGSEVFHRRPGRGAKDGRSALLPVHALTVVNAFRSSFRQSEDAATRRLLLVQATAWTASLRDALGSTVGLSMAGADLRTSLAKCDEPLPRLERRLRDSLMRVGQEHHQHKYAAAMFEEAGRVQPSLRRMLVLGQAWS